MPLTSTPYAPPLEKSTYHAFEDPPASGEDVQKPVAGVFGNAVVSIVGHAATVKSTRVDSSFTLGMRQPPPASVREAQ